MLIRAHPNDASDLTDNARLVTAKKPSGPFFLEEDIWKKNKLNQPQLRIRDLELKPAAAGRAQPGTY